MKKTFISAVLCTGSVMLFGQQHKNFNDTSSLHPVEVLAIRANDKAPFTKTNLNKEQLAKLNTGQDLPFLLNQTPSVVVNSDAGNAVGYTGIRIRGTDGTRVNVTLNGIPYNDAESMGSYFVDLPDIASSTNSIQVQRGVGTSSNGAGAFGGTISISTNEYNEKAYGEINNSYGSFNTWKNTVKVGSGLINGHFTVDARLSRVSSDGFIDRASSDLQSFYLSTAYINKKSSLRLNIISGKEKTFQAWNGIPEAKLKGNDSALLVHYYNNLGYLYFTTADSLNLFNSNKNKYDLPLYKNETDNYVQTHYQLLFNHTINKAWNLNTALFLSRGLGYYENYKHDQSFSDYGLPDVVIGEPAATISQTDLVRQRWLDNYYYGQTLALQYQATKSTVTIGGGWTVYDGKHYGDVIWAKYGIDKDYEYYNNKAKKTDINIYTKWQYQLTKNLSLFADIQYRYVKHTMNGFDDQPTLLIDRDFNFVNPKAGISYTKNGWQTYFSYAMANKEPNRDDFETGTSSQPKKETLYDFELGTEKRTKNYFFGATAYYMLYKDQLVLTGKVNDVGAYTRINVPNSYRLGLELQGGYSFNKYVNATANLTVSANKIKAFTEYLDIYDVNYDYAGQEGIEHKNTDIAFSPATVGAASINILPVKNLEISLLSKYVSKQYLDNTSSDAKKLDSYYMQDIRFIYTLKHKLFNEWSFIAQVNNVFNKQYQPNGYTYGSIYDNGQPNGKTVTTENFYFPMAGTNFMFTINVKL